jgi:hypothetical protein
MSQYLHRFLLDEVALHEPKDMDGPQKQLASLFSNVLSRGTPVDPSSFRTSSQAMYQMRNSEETLLACMNACARVTQQLSMISQPNPTALGAWLRRVQGQRTGGDSALAVSCLSRLNLPGAVLHVSDLYRADFSYSNLAHLQAVYACLALCNLRHAILTGAELIGARLDRTDLSGANLTGATLIKASLRGCIMRDTILEDADLTRADMQEIDGRPVGTPRRDPQGQHTAHGNRRGYRDTD